MVSSNYPLAYYWQVGIVRTVVDMWGREQTLQMALCGCVAKTDWCGVLQINMCMCQDVPEEAKEN